MSIGDLKDVQRLHIEESKREFKASKKLKSNVYTRRGEINSNCVKNKN